MTFCHLHVHSDYSIIDGLARVEDLVRAAGERGMGSLALTDHGNLCGAIAFYKEARKAGIRPVLGIEAYVAPGARGDRRKDPLTNVSSYHLTLLAKDLEGWRNLMVLATSAFTEGYYYHPRIDHELLARHSRGLIALSGCLKGETSLLLRTGNERKAYETAAFYRDLLGPDYFVEIQRNGAEGQEPNNRALVKMARDLGVPLVASNDVHYVSREDARAQEVRMAISTGKVLADEKRLQHATDDFWLKSADEMRALFPDFPEALDATMEIASRCSVEIPMGEFHLPRFEPPPGTTPESYFRDLCRRGLVERYGDPPQARAVERLETEMAVIEKMGFVSYFLIVWDFIRYARERSIPVGPGRGSAAGSIVAYALRITDVCPLHHDLLFERFLNSERISMPDIDVDFCRDGRAEVIRYVTEKYGGSGNVTQIVTFGTMAARAVIRDVGRVLGVPLAEIDGIAKKIPNGPNDTLSGAIAADPDVQAIRNESRYSELFDVALRLEGINRHPSTHAAGVVIGDGELVRHVPLQKVDDNVVTQFTMDVLEDVGLLKMDFLGLKTLTVLDKAVRLIERSGGGTAGGRATGRIDLDALPLDDAPTWALLQRGDALGVFQLESGGMRDLLQRLRPDRFEDLIAILALYRPGPLQTGMVDQFVRRKHGLEPVTHLHPSLEPLLRDTYGTFVYQEQIMLIAQRLGGFSLNRADGLRKAMGKKKLDVMLRYKGEFVDGAVRNGVERSVADQIWDVMQQFAEYAFNKSHTTAYAVLTYRTAWLKANHPVEFMAASLTCDLANTDKVVAAVDEMRRMGIPLLPPDVRTSEVEFAVEGGSERAGGTVPPADSAARPARAIRFGLAGVKGLGIAVAEAIVAARGKARAPFASLSDLCEAVGPILSRTALEPLVGSGALDALAPHGARGGTGERRAALLAAVEGALRQAAAVHEDRRAGQMSLFGAAPPGRDEGAVAESSPAAALGASNGPSNGVSNGRAAAEAPRWGEKEILAAEKASLGFYLSSHPLARHERTLRALSTASTSGLAAAANGARVFVGGMVTQFRTQYPKTGRNTTRKMARFRFEDFEGGVSCVMFADGYERDAAHLADEAIGVVEATVDLSREEPDLRIERFVPVEEAYADLVTSLVIAAPSGEESRAVASAKRLLEAFPGKARLLLDLRPGPGLRALYRIERGGLRPCRELHDALAADWGGDAVRWKLRAPQARQRSFEATAT